jgi:hypothetical protein
MRRVGLELTALAFQRTKSVHALEGAASVIGPRGHKPTKQYVSMKKQREQRPTRSMVHVLQLGTFMAMRSKSYEYYELKHISNSVKTTAKYMCMREMCLYRRIYVILVCLLQKTLYFSQVVSITTEYKLHGLSPRANYTDSATAACRRS